MDFAVEQLSTITSSMDDIIFANVGVWRQKQAYLVNRDDFAV